MVREAFQDMTVRTLCASNRCILSKLHVTPKVFKKPPKLEKAEKQKKEMNRKEYIDKIAKYLARFVEEVKSYNDMNLYDYNIHAENALIPILNAVFELKLVNANSIKEELSLNWFNWWWK